jgi:hypothetical protein
MTEQQDQGQTAPQESTTPQQAKPEQPYFVAKTKDEYERTFGPTRQEGRDALLKKLGFEKPTELENFVTEYRQLQEDAKSETDRERDARLAAEQERDKYRSLADTRLVDSELRIALLNAGVPSDRVAAAAKLVDRDSVQVDNGAVSGLEEAVQSTVDSMPWLMGEATQPTYRAADTTQLPTNNGADPQQQHANFLASLLNGP